jgi:hypothetical protein
MRPAELAIMVIGLVVYAAPASAQIDPLLFLKGSQPNVILMVDTSERMQRDAPTDPTTVTTSNATSSYYDPFVYTRAGEVINPWESALGVNDTNTTPNGKYRRKFNSLIYSAGSDKATTSSIGIVGDADSVAFARFEAPTRLALARAAMYQAVKQNMSVARFGLFKTRQTNPIIDVTTPVLRTNGTDRLQLSPTETAIDGRWNLYRGRVDISNRSNVPVACGMSARLVAADAPHQNSEILAILKKDPRQPAPVLLPAGLDDESGADSPVAAMVKDTKEAARCLTIPAGVGQCHNTVAVLITGGGEGTTNGGADPVAEATAFLLAIVGRRVPVIVVAIAPPLDQVAQLTAVATESGGQYVEVTRAQIDVALNSVAQANTSVPGTVVVPELVHAINLGVQTAFQNFTDLNTKPFWTGPWVGWKGYAGSAKIPSTEFQVASPAVGTVNLTGARDINGTDLPEPPTVKDRTGNVIPRRNNVLVTSGFVLPGFDGMLRGFRVYKPVADATQPSGYRFQADNTPLWIAAPPSDPNARNLFTALPNGTLIALNTSPGSLARLAPLMNLTIADAAVVIEKFRQMPLGAIIDSTPAIMNPPSLDPPPDAAYPSFRNLHKDRRSIVWVGTNRGVLEALDARTGLEVWGFVPLNLLPKLKALREGQAVGKFDYFMDGSPKISDVRLPGICDDAHPELCWRTHLVVGQGPGGTFYQSFDVTLDGLDAAVPSDGNNTAALLSFFADPSRITLNWAFPQYSHFDPTIATSATPFGDLHATNATTLEKSVGQTWSVPAVGQIVSASGPYSVLFGSGFLPWSIQHQANRAGAPGGGTMFYVLNAKDGSLHASMDVGNDGLNETVDDCGTIVNGCKQIKNALQTDPVTTAHTSQRFITTAYLADLDGSVWRFNIDLDGSFKPFLSALTRVYPANPGASDQPIFSSMATVNDGVNQYIFFGTGSDLLPSTDAGTLYHLIGINDNGTRPSPKTVDVPLAKTTSLSVEEKVSAFPAVAGDRVFFTTTTFAPSSSCSAPVAKLYAMTFTGGPAYDTNNDHLLNSSDSTRLAEVAGARATAPFIVDQHLMFGSGGKVAVFGDPADFNNGIGNAGVRILSWREVR